MKSAKFHFLLHSRIFCQSDLLFRNYFTPQISPCPFLKQEAAAKKQLTARTTTWLINDEELITLIVEIFFPNFDSQNTLEKGLLVNKSVLRKLLTSLGLPEELMLTRCLYPLRRKI